MRKLGILLAIMATLVFFYAAQASAEDKTVEQRLSALENSVGAWSFYGSARFATFYEQHDDVPWYNDADGNFDFNDNDKISKWGQQSNSRFGANVNKGALGGKVEIGLAPDSGTQIRTRKIFGTYTFNDCTLLIGQDDTPLGDFGSGQVFSGDLGLQDFGIMDENRTPQIKIKYKGFQIAFVDVRDTAGDDLGASLVGTNATTQVLLPHVELRYTMSTDKFYTDLFGGYNWYTVKADEFRKDVNAFAGGVDFGVTLDQVYANATFYAARNGKELGIIQSGQIGAIIDANGVIKNSQDLGCAVVLGFNIQKVTIEAGYGYVESKNDEFNNVDNAQDMYLQAVIPVAAMNGAKFTIVPEIGIIDNMQDATNQSEGSARYAGAKWQIDF
jgi:hypothetical protein